MRLPVNLFNTWKGVMNTTHDQKGMIDKMNEQENDEQEATTEAMNGLRHLFIFHEPTGVCLYYHPFTMEKIDPQLISGFLSAITSFGGKFEEKTAKKKKSKKHVVAETPPSDLKELVYKEYRILMETRRPCKFAVLIVGQATDILRSKVSEFIDHFMQTYGEALKDWKDDVRIFKDVHKIVALIFGFTKVQPDYTVNAV